MVSADGSCVLVYNGELYNHRELRSALVALGRSFRSESDTEVVLEALLEWGPDALRRFNGMFALALWDDPNGSLLLARDHAGIKPLYLSSEPNGRGLAFASTLDALLEVPWVDRECVRPEALRDLVMLGHVPPPLGFLRDTEQLEPGHMLLRDREGRLTRRCWWAPPADGWGGERTQFELDELDALLHRVVERQKVADVPLGSFLSGGIDSALVTSIAREQTGPEFQTFTVSNPGWAQDEGPDARRYVQALGVSGHELAGEDATGPGLWAEVAGAQYEPFGDFSVLPSLQVCKAARSRVTVALSGDGGDELFYGYERPFSLLRAGRRFCWPRAVRRLRYILGRLHLLPELSSVIVESSAGAYYRNVNSRMPVEWFRRILPGVPSGDAGGGIYDDRGAVEPMALARFSRAAEWRGQLQRCLKKVDMASMYHSLEVRVPLLDRELVEFAFALHPAALVRHGVRKKPLRDLLGRYVDPSIIPTAKRGFAVPLGEWLRAELRPTMERLLLDEPLYPDGMIDPVAVRAYVEEHLQGRSNHKWGLYALMSLQAWARGLAA